MLVGIFCLIGKHFKGWHTKMDNGTIHFDAPTLDEEDNTINGGDLMTHDVYSTIMKKNIIVENAHLATIVNDLKK
ncbi:MAG: hypothetical protein ABJA35_13950 [Parafilimonas sp.]